MKAHICNQFIIIKAYVVTALIMLMQVFENYCNFQEGSGLSIVMHIRFLNLLLLYKCLIYNRFSVYAILALILNHLFF